MSRARENGTCASFLAPTWHLCQEVGTAGRPEDVGTGAVNGFDQARQQHITDDGQGAGRPAHRVPADNLPGTPTSESVPETWHRSTAEVPTCLARDNCPVPAKMSGLPDSCQERVRAARSPSGTTGSALVRGVRSRSRSSPPTGTLTRSVARRRQDPCQKCVRNARAPDTFRGTGHPTFVPCQGKWHLCQVLGTDLAPVSGSWHRRAAGGCRHRCCERV